MANGVGSWHYPFIPGLDVAGVIDEVGEGLGGWEKGDAVYYHSNYKKTGWICRFHYYYNKYISAHTEGSNRHRGGRPSLRWHHRLSSAHRKTQYPGRPNNSGARVDGGVGGFAIQIATKLDLEVITTASVRNFE